MPISFEEFERVDFGVDDVELLNGVVLRMPLPRKKSISGVATGFPRSAHLAQTGRQPDARRSAHRRFYLGAPLIAFEVVSESETAAYLDEKVSECLAHGAAEVWLIYPATVTPGFATPPAPLDSRASRYIAPSSRAWKSHSQKFCNAPCVIMCFIIYGSIIGLPHVAF
jgi:hypothetical protein